MFALRSIVAMMIAAMATADVHADALAAGNTPKTDTGESKNFRRNDEDQWTSLCSHVHCIGRKKFNPDSGAQEVHHVEVHSHSLETYGHKHLCKMHLHVMDMCGCECYNEAAGMDEIFSQITEQAKGFSALYGQGYEGEDEFHAANAAAANGE